MEIQAKSKLFDVLNEYPALEDKVMRIAPPFRNLKNPVLRKTVGKLATIERVAQIGSLEVLEFVNILRREVGQPELRCTVESEIKWQEGEPEWIKEEPAHRINGTEMLSRGEHPLQKINQLMREAKKGQFILLSTNFKPLPMIDEMQKQDYQVFSKADDQNPDQHYTFIRK